VDTTVETGVFIGNLIKEIVMVGSIVTIMGVITILPSDRAVLVIRISANVE
jgi:hypothetical protein